MARLLADLKGDAREVDAHVRLEDDDNCLEDTELKYVYVVRECARDVYTTHTMHTQSTPLYHEVQS